MPSLTIHTNIHIEGMDVNAILEEATDLLVEGLEKPREFIMVRLETRSHLMFGGSDGPAAFVELISLGLPDEAPAQLTPKLSDFIQKKLGIKPERMYLSFPQIPRTHFGWNGKTFA